MFNTTNALVLREVRYKEADKMLTLLTASDGKLSAKARGALRKGSKISAATQQLTYAQLTMFQNKGRWTVNEASVIEPFKGLREDIGSFALGCYFAECIEAFGVEQQADAALLQLGLNSLYALSRGLYAPELIKAAFELRLMCMSGYEPNLYHCSVCGSEAPEKPFLDLENGGLCCKKCRGIATGATAELCNDSLGALRYIAAAPAKQLFSFKLGEGARGRLSDAAERYMLSHAERGFSTLNYWKKVK